MATDGQRITFQKGLDLDTDQAFLEEGSYRFSLNNRVTSIEGKTIALQNIRGNELILKDGKVTSMLSDGFFVVASEMIDNSMYILSHNPDTGISEIGLFFTESIFNRSVFKYPLAFSPNPILDIYVDCFANPTVITDADADQYHVLYRHTDLHLSLNKKPVLRTEIQYDNSISLYWTDGVIEQDPNEPLRLNINPPRRFNTAQDYRVKIYKRHESPVGSDHWVSDGFQCYYDVSKLDDILPLKMPTISLDGNPDDQNISDLLESGGILDTGGYRAVVRYLDENNNFTNWSYPSDLIVIVPDANVTFKEGSDSGLSTSKRFKVRVTGLDTRYKYIQLGAIQYVSDVAFSGKVMQKIALSDDNFVQDRITLYCDGRFFDNFDFNDIIIEPIYVNTAECLELVQNRMFLGNITEANYHNQKFIDFADRTTVYWNIKEVVKDRVLTGTKGKAGYKNEVNIFNRVGYWKQQDYTFYLQYVLTNGQKSFLYPCGQIQDANQVIQDRLLRTHTRNIIKASPTEITLQVTTPGFQFPSDLIFDLQKIGVQGIAIYRSDRQGNIVLCEGLLTQSPTHNAPDIRYNDDDYRFAPDMSAFDSDPLLDAINADGCRTKICNWGWRLLNLMSSQANDDSNQPVQLKNRWNLFFDDMLFSGNGAGSQPTISEPWGSIAPWAVKNELCLFVPEPHITRNLFSTRRGDHIQVRYKSSNQDNITDTQYFEWLSNVADLNTASDVLGDHWIKPSQIKRYLHYKTLTDPDDFFDINTYDPNQSIFKDYNLEGSIYLDYDNLNEAELIAYRYRNLAPFVVPESNVDTFRSDRYSSCNDPLLNDILISGSVPNDYLISGGQAQSVFMQKFDNNFKKSWYFRMGSNIIAWATKDSNFCIINPEVFQTVTAYIQDIGIKPVDQRSVFYCQYFSINDLLEQRSSSFFNNTLYDWTKVQWISPDIKLPHIFSGDCYINEAFMPIAVQENASGSRDLDLGSDLNLGVLAGFHVESMQNLELRYEKPDAEETYFPKSYGWRAFEGAQRNDARRYNPADSVINRLTTGSIINKTILEDYQLAARVTGNAIGIRKFFSRIVNSPKKVIGERIDQYRRFLPNDFKDEKYNYGEITYLMNVNDNLLVVQERAILMEPINMPALSETTAGATQLGTGGVFLPRPQILGDGIGSKHKFSIVKTDSGVYGYDYRNYLIWRVTDKIEKLSEEKKIYQLLVKLSPNHFKDQITKTSHTEVLGFYDGLFGEIYYSFLNYKPDQGIDTSQTLIFSESQDCFIGNYYQVPDQETNYSNNINTNPYFYARINTDSYVFPKFVPNNSPNKFYLQNYARHGEFFGIPNHKATIHFIVNKDPDMTKVFDNMILYFNGYDDLQKYNPYIFFNDIKVITEYQNTGNNPVPIRGKNKERKWYCVLPREEFNLDNNPLRDRLRDRYCRIELDFDPDQLLNPPNQDNIPVGKLPATFNSNSVEFCSYELIFLDVLFRRSFR